MDWKGNITNAGIAAILIGSAAMSTPWGISASEVEDAGTRPKDDSPIVGEPPIDDPDVVLKLDSPEKATAAAKTSGKRAKTIRVRKASDFPRVLAPGLRLALFLDDLMDADDLAGSDFVIVFGFKSEVKRKKREPASIKRRSKRAGRGEPSGNRVSVLLNNKYVARLRVGDGGGSVRALLPRSFFGGRGDIIQIRNDGNSAFKRLSLRLIKGATRSIFQNSVIPGRIKALSSAVTSFARLGDAYQIKLLRMISELIAQGLSEEEEPDVAGSLELLLSNPGFVDNLTGRPRKSFVALSAVSSLFDGEPERLAANLLPTAADGYLSGVAWVAVANSPGRITVLLSSRGGEAGEVELILPVEGVGDDFSAEAVDARTRFITGITPHDLPAGFASGIERRNLKTSIVPVENGLIKLKFNIPRSAVIEFRFGKRRDESVSPRRVKPLKTDRTVLTRVRCSRKLTRPPVGSLIYSLRPNGVRAKASGAGAAARTASATRSVIAGVRGVVPWDEKSVFAEFNFSGGPAADAGRCVMFLRHPPAKFDSLEFWVRPKETGKMKSIGMRLHLLTFDNRQGSTIKCRLRPGVWQRLSVPAPSNGNAWNSVVLAPNPASGDFKRGNKITYEFNGFSALTAQSSGFHRRVSFEKDGKGRLKSMKLLFIDSPGKVVGCAITFKRVVVIDSFETSTSAVSVDIKPEVSFVEPARVLRIRLQLPRKRYFVMTDELSKFLSDKEKSIMSKIGAHATLLTLRFERPEIGRSRHASRGKTIPESKKRIGRRGGKQTGEKSER